MVAVAYVATMCNYTYSRLVASDPLRSYLICVGMMELARPDCQLS